VHHQRAFSMLSVQSVEVELVLQTRNPAHVQDVVARLGDAGFEARAY
jgi:threonine dehydratase